MTTITDTYLSRLKTPKDKSVEFFDSQLSGFGVRVGKRGDIKFLIDYRTQVYDLQSGTYKEVRPRKVFGKWDRENPDPDMKIYNAKLARLQAEIMLTKAKQGIDPFEDAPRKRGGAATVGDLLDEFIERHVKHFCKPKTLYYSEIAVRMNLKPFIGNLPLKSLTKSDVERLHQETSIRRPHPTNKKKQLGGKTTANRCLALLKAALNKAVDWGYIETNPASRVKGYVEKKSNRYLREDELERLYTTMRELEEDRRNGHRFVDCNAAVRLALLTGCRQGELLKARWENFDLDSTPATWSKPTEDTKQKEWEHIPLSADCVDILRERKAANDNKEEPSPYVFPHKYDPSRPCDNLNKSWRALRKKAGLEDFRFHDLRHTFASYMAMNGKSLYVIGRMLGHKSTQTTQRYAKLNTNSLRELADDMAAIVKRGKVSN